MECDGLQHRVRSPSWHPTEQHFIEQQNADKIKTIIPLFYNQTVLRISNDKIENIDYCISFLLNYKLNRPTIFFDDINMYRYIVSVDVNNTVNIDIKDLIDKFIDKQFINQVNNAYNRISYNIVDIKTEKVYSNEI